MHTHIPQSVVDYIEGRNQRDLDIALSGFAPTAVVADENHTHAGVAAIRAWMADTIRQYDNTQEVLDATPSASGIDLSVRVSGTFPGSPITLTFRFTLAGETITRLEFA